MPMPSRALFLLRKDASESTIDLLALFTAAVPAFTAELDPKRAWLPNLLLFLQHQGSLIYRFAMTVIWPPMHRILEGTMASLVDSPDLVVLALCGILLFLCWHMLLWIRRLIIFWTKFFGFLLFCSGIVALAATAYRLGPEATFDLVLVLVGRVAGFAAFARDHFMREWQRYEDQRSSAAGHNLPANRRSGWT